MQVITTTVYRCNDSVEFTTQKAARIHLNNNITKQLKLTAQLMSNKTSSEIEKYLCGEGETHIKDLVDCIRELDHAESNKFKDQ